MAKKKPNPKKQPGGKSSVTGSLEILDNFAAPRARKPALKPGPVPGFTQKFADDACAMIAEGVPQWVAFEANGVPRRTAKYWMDEYPEFGRQVEQARAQICARIVGEIRQAVTPGEFGVPDWKARAWVAGKVMKEDFGEEKGKTEVNVGVLSLSPDSILKIAALV